MSNTNIQNTIWDYIFDIKTLIFLFFIFLTTIVMCLIFTIYTQNVLISDSLHDLISLQTQINSIDENFTSLVKRQDLDILELKKSIRDLSTVSDKQSNYVNTTIAITSLALVTTIFISLFICAVSQ
jgi:predicted PurR-regulated permease PerM